MLKNVLHDWNDEQCATILANVRAAIPAHGKLLEVERVIADDPEGLRSELSALMMDLNMLVCLGALDRTEAEFRSLLDEVSFSLKSVGKPIGEGDGIPKIQVLTARPA